MTQKESHDYLTYYSLCNLMADFIDEKWANKSQNVRKVKLLTNQLKGELEKSIDHIFQSKDSEGVNMESVLDQFVNASQIMVFFFNVGLQMDEIDEDKKVELNDKLNELLLNYNINLNMYKNER
jgi:uncharacterized protein YicC (UPF0701 family)